MNSSHTNVEAERALTRLEQLAREEHTAVMLSDLDMLCRVSALLPEAVARLEAAGRRGIECFDERVSAIQSTHQLAEVFLTEKMTENRKALKQLGGVRRTMRGYRTKHKSITGLFNTQG
jgi:hypothetical protein